MSKKALITGAADGIGRAIAAEALRVGYQVIGVDVDAERAAITASELGAGARFITADLTTPDGWQKTVSDAGDHLSLVVHNAGINEVGYFENTDISRQHAVISLNLVAPMALTRELLAKDALTPNASLVFISSLSRYVSYPGASVYAGTKDGIASYARSLAIGYPQRHVMTVYPGPTRTIHARRYAPDNSREDKRMPPEQLASMGITWCSAAAAGVDSGCGKLGICNFRETATGCGRSCHEKIAAGKI